MLFDIISSPPRAGRQARLGGDESKKQGSESESRAEHEYLPHRTCARSYFALKRQPARSPATHTSLFRSTDVARHELACCAQQTPSGAGSLLFNVEMTAAQLLLLTTLAVAVSSDGRR